MRHSPGAHNFCFRKKEHGKAEVWSSEFAEDMANLKSAGGINSFQHQDNSFTAEEQADSSFAAKEQRCQVNGVEVRVNLPERSRDTVGPGNVRRLQKSGSPSPLADNNRGSQTGLDHSTSSTVRIEKDQERIEKNSSRKSIKSKRELVLQTTDDQTKRLHLLEMLTCLVTPFSKVLVDEDNTRRENTE
jgi:hypothetical protein